MSSLTWNFIHWWSFFRYRLSHNHKLKAYLNTYDYEKIFFQLDNNLMNIRRLKENILNSTKQKDLNKVTVLLKNLIILYSHSSLVIFWLIKKTPIENYYITDNDGNEKRQSNDPKDFKRYPRGLSNFEYACNRLI